MEQPNEAVLTQYGEAAVAIEAQLRALGGAPEDRAAEAEYKHTGSVVFAAAFFFTELVAAFDFENGVRVVGTGRLYGVGAGAGTSWGGGAFYVEPSSLIGLEVDCTVGVVSGTLLLAEFWLNGKKIGYFLGGGLGVGLLAMGGKVKFTKR